MKFSAKDITRVFELVPNFEVIYNPRHADHKDHLKVIEAYEQFYREVKDMGEYNIDVMYVHVVHEEYQVAYETH